MNDVSASSLDADPIAFIDLKAQRKRIAERLDRAIKRVLDHGQFIMGPEVADLEARLAGFCGARYCITCGNGTDALALTLMAKGVKPGDAVFVPAFTFVATAEVVAWLGARPVFVDVDPDTFNMAPGSLAEAVAWSRGAGLVPRAVIPVDLFGQPADYRALLPIAEAEGLFVLSDAAQSFGAGIDGQRVGTFGLATATSFYPAKPLGCYGDGGAIFTDDPDLAARLRSLRTHGEGSDRYHHPNIGMNGRLDTLQAAILLEKLAIFPDEIVARQHIAERYTERLGNCVRAPRLMPKASSVWAQYTIVSERRDRIASACKEAGVPTAIHYPITLPQQAAYRHFPTTPGGVPRAERLAREVLSLPMHPYLEPAMQDQVIAVVRRAAGN